jgi:hypothetical protein
MTYQSAVLNLLIRRGHFLCFSRNVQRAIEESVCQFAPKYAELPHFSSWGDYCETNKFAKELDRVDQMVRVELGCNQSTLYWNMLRNQPDVVAAINDIGYKWYEQGLPKEEGVYEARCFFANNHENASLAVKHFREGLRHLVPCPGNHGRAEAGVINVGSQGDRLTANLSNGETFWLNELPDVFHWRPKSVIL